MGFFRNLFSSSLPQESFSCPNRTLLETMTPSPDARHLAYLVKDWQGMHAEVNGSGVEVQGTAGEGDYNFISGLTFSPNSQRLAFGGERDGKWYLVCDEIEFGPYDDIGQSSPVFSPDSSHVAYTVKLGDRWFAAVDGGIVSDGYESFCPGGIIFSPDSRRLGYVIKRGDSWCPVVDGTELATYSGVLQRSWTFSPDSRRFAYVATTEGGLIGGKFVGKECVVVDGQHLETWKRDETTGASGVSDEIVFSPDSRRMAYGVTQGGRFFFVVDGKPERQYGGLVSGRKGNADFASVPGYGKASWRNEPLTFSPDSQHYAYAVVDTQGHVVVFDGEERARHETIMNGPIIFSLDSRRVAYGATTGGRQHMVVDWHSAEPFWGIATVTPSFSPDSQRLAYVAMNQRNDFLLAVDSERWRIHDGPIIGAPLVWDDSRQLHTIVGKGRTATVQSWKSA